MLSIFGQADDISFLTWLAFAGPLAFINLLILASVLVIMFMSSAWCREQLCPECVHRPDTEGEQKGEGRGGRGRGTTKVISQEISPLGFSSTSQHSKDNNGDDGLVGNGARGVVERSCVSSARKGEAAGDETVQDDPAMSCAEWTVVRCIDVCWC